MSLKVPKTQFPTIEYRMRRIVVSHFKRDYVLWNGRRKSLKPHACWSIRTFNGYKLSGCACQEMLHLACKTQIVRTIRNVVPIRDILFDSSSVVWLNN